MVIRTLLYALALLLIVVGISQLLLTRWWIGVTYTLTASPYIYVSTAIGIIFGGTLLIAAIRRMIGLRVLMIILGLYSLITSFVLAANPGLAQDLMNALIFNHARSFQFFIVFLAGLLRIAIGILIFYALANPSQRRRTIDESQPSV